MPAKNVLMTKAVNLYFEVLIPIMRASDSLSFIALKAKPILDFIIRYIAVIETIANVITKM